MKLTLTDQFISLGHQLSAERDSAHDLWTWLPSHKVAEKNHGDYASEFCPSVKDVMVEAAMYLAHLARPDVPVTPDEQEWFARCPCDQDHVAPVVDPEAG
jgi:hypothetical protein